MCRTRPERLRLRVGNALALGRFNPSINVDPTGSPKRAPVSRRWALVLTCLSFHEEEASSDSPDPTLTHPLHLKYYTSLLYSSTLYKPNHPSTILINQLLASSYRYVCYLLSPTLTISMAKQDKCGNDPNPHRDVNDARSDNLHLTVPQAPPSYATTGQFMLIALLITAAVSLLFFILYSFLRHRHQRRRRLVNWDRPRLVFSIRAEPSPRRLDQNVIDSIPVVELPQNAEDSTESCAVCISEFAHGEKVRVLPQCGHRFHLECIDMWFGSHSTCPLCRADVNSPVAVSDVGKLEEAENKEVDRSIIVECGHNCSSDTNNHSPFYGSRVHHSPLDDMV